MCGIAGILDGRERVSPGLIDAMANALAHRGPDGGRVRLVGSLAIGHRRLSILDPTSAGDQPMVSPDHRLHLVHNGEIYNFLELRDQLRAAGREFRTETDTEVILAAYATWGPRCVERFNGIWALALWDAAEDRLFLSRDRLGVKPLFLAEHDGVLAFASEIKGLLVLPWKLREPDGPIVRDFLLDGRVDHTDRTFLKGIHRLPAGHNLLVSGRHRRLWRYWHPGGLGRDARLDAQPQDATSVEDLRACLIDSVALQLRTDVPIGSCLSGGLDSSSIVATASALRRGTLATRDGLHRERDGHPQLAFFAGFADKGIDERRFADAAARSAGVELRTTTPDHTAFAADLEDIVRSQDEPFTSTSIVAQYHVMKLARATGIRVLLDGQGADELLAGYPANAAPREAGALRSRDVGRVLGRWMRGSWTVSPTRALWYVATDGALPPTWARSSRRIRDWLGPAVGNGDPVEIDIPKLEGTILARAMWRDVAATHLPALLRYEDRNSMRFGIEARVPFLDHRLVEAALLLPDRLKVADGVHKVALRRAVTGLVPDSVIARRDKVGFASPERRWLGESLTLLAPLGRNSASERSGLLQPRSVSRSIEQWMRGQLPTDVMWRILSLELWARVVLDDERHVLAVG
jgi:asparagine synthase (glutamine-hydrolysing)